MFKPKKFLCARLVSIVAVFVIFLGYKVWKDLIHQNRSESTALHPAFKFRKLLAVAEKTGKTFIHEKETEEEEKAEHEEVEGGTIDNNVAEDIDALISGGYERPNCTTPAYHEFPADLFSEDQREHGAIVVHLAVVIYIFLALAIVCDDYFVSSLGKVCDILHLSEDVAGATFMAAGSSAPELFTSVLGVFVAKGDVGTGTIVGSAVFNILCIVGVCGICTGEEVALSWWPLIRDAGYYAVTIIALIMVIHDGVVTWYDSIFMLMLYGGYIVIMKYNQRIQFWFTSQLEKQPLLSAQFDGATTGIAEVQGHKVKSNYERFEEDHDDSGFTQSELEAGYYQAADGRGYGAAANVGGHGYGYEHDNTRLIILDSLTRFKTPERKLRFDEAGLFVLAMCRKFSARTKLKALSKLLIIERRRLIKQGLVRRRSSVYKNVRSFSRQLTLEDPDLPTFDDSWRKPPNIGTQGMIAFAQWIFVAPIRYAFFFTIPDCRKTRFEKYFLATFVLSIVWIAGLSYIMVWMVTLIGYTLGIPDSIMGITFLAAGTSIPDMIASIIVVRQGQGDMAVSNSVGSNVFDILIGLAVPWMLQTVFVAPGSKVHINSNGIVFSVVLLFTTVIALVGGVKYNGWCLNKRLGFICLGLYAVFLTISVMIESNVFGYVNPPNCRE